MFVHILSELYGAPRGPENIVENNIKLNWKIQAKEQQTTTPSAHQHNLLLSPPVSKVKSWSHHDSNPNRQDRHMEKYHIDFSIPPGGLWRTVCEQLVDIVNLHLNTLIKSVLESIVVCTLFVIKFPTPLQLKQWKSCRCINLFCISSVCFQLRIFHSNLKAYNLWEFEETFLLLISTVVKILNVVFHLRFKTVIVQKLNH